MLLVGGIPSQRAGHRFVELKHPCHLGHLLRRDGRVKGLVPAAGGAIPAARGHEQPRPCQHGPHDGGCRQRREPAPEPATWSLGDALVDRYDRSPWGLMPPLT